MCRSDLYALFHAIRVVESGGHRDPRHAVGDGGRALGPYQIHYRYWKDAVEHDPTLYGTEYEGVRDQRYAEQVMLAYWDRYAPDWKPETLARIHNGGPSGHQENRTLGYWRKVHSALTASLIRGGGPGVPGANRMP